MIYPPVPDVEGVAAHFIRAVRQAHRDDQPYRHWNLTDVFPESICTGILALPIVPAMLGRTDGTRGSGFLMAVADWLQRPEEL